MAFTLKTWSRSTTSANEPIDLQQDGTTYFGGPRVYTYVSTDTQATIAAANYFNTVAGDLVTGDVILSYSITDGTQVWLAVTNSNSYATPFGGNITVAGFSSASPINTADITNNAVTYAKFQQVAAVSLVGNPTGGLANAEGITLGAGLDFTGTTLEVSASLAQYAQVAMTAAEFNGMYAAPKLLVAAPGANKLIVLDKILLNQTFVSASYAAGGVVAPQYDSTVQGAGTAASDTTIAAATINGIASNSIVGLRGLIAVTASAALINKGIYLSNATGAFTTGDGTWTVDVWYHTVSAA